jgi:hypothetical protein
MLASCLSRKMTVNEAIFSIEQKMTFFYTVAVVELIIGGLALLVWFIKAIV